MSSNFITLLIVILTFQISTADTSSAIPSVTNSDTSTVFSLPMPINPALFTVSTSKINFMLTGNSGNNSSSLDSSGNSNSSRNSNSSGNLSSTGISNSSGSSINSGNSNSSGNSSSSGSSNSSISSDSSDNLKNTSISDNSIISSHSGSSGNFDQISQPLFISQYLPNDYVKAQRLAKVNVPQLNALNITSYSGYITVDTTFNANLFFWYFPCECSTATVPVALWLNGGPGISSLIGLFTENGPISVNNNGNLVRRNYSWTKNHHMLYIDNPVGNGYSFTDNDDADYANNQTIIAGYLLSAVQQFFQLFPNLQSLPFYLTGETYAGKYLLDLSHAILNTETNSSINIQGMAIGNGFIDPINQLNYDDHLYQLGFIDLHGQAEFKAIQDQIIYFIKQEAWLNATQLYSTLFTRPSPPYTKPLYTELTGLTNFYNYYEGSPGNPLVTEEPTALTEFLYANSTRAGIHVGNKCFHGVNKLRPVTQHLTTAFLMNQKNYLCEALQNMNVFLYNGQFDIQFAYPMMENYLQKLNCIGLDEYNTANRTIWTVDDNTAGYVKKVNNLTEILIRVAGQFVSRDQPYWAYLMIDQLTSKQNYANM